MSLSVAVDRRLEAICIELEDAVLEEGRALVPGPREVQHEEAAQREVLARAGRVEADVGERLILAGQLPEVEQGREQALVSLRVLPAGDVAELVADGPVAETGQQEGEVAFTGCHELDGSDPIPLGEGVPSVRRGADVRRAVSAEHGSLDKEQVVNVPHNHHVAIEEENSLIWQSEHVDSLIGRDPAALVLPKVERNGRGRDFQVLEIVDVDVQAMNQMQIFGSDIFSPGYQESIRRDWICHQNGQGH